MHSPRVSAPRRLDDLPGPKGLPIVGNALGLDVERLHESLEAWIDEYGSYYTIKLGPKRALVTCDHAAMREVLRARPDAFRRPEKMKRVFAEVRTDGVFTAEGSSWKRQRKLMMAALSPRTIQKDFGTVKRSVERLASLWSQHAGRGDSVEADAEFQRFAVDVATSVAFGVDVNTVEKGQTELRQYLELMFPTINRRVNSTVPYWRWFKLPRDRAFDRALAVLRDKVGVLIADARRRLEEDPSRAEHPADLIEAMLVAHDDENEAMRVTDDEIFANALTLLIAGEDTTSNTAAWMFDHLARDPELQSRLREEIHRELGPDGIADDPRALSRLPLLDAVVQETLRLRSAAPLMFFESYENQRVGDVEVDPEVLIIFLTRKAALDEGVFDDAARFDPDRWLEAAAGSERTHDPAAVLAFGYGPRICPGRSLALLELSLLGAALTARFEYSPVSATPPSELFQFTMGPTEVRLKLKAAAAASPAELSASAE